MRYFLPIILLALIIINTNSQTQTLPHNLTAAEKELLNEYIHPVNSLLSDPPPTPVRTMAEWEELQGIMITWASFYSILRQVVDYAQEEGLVYIVCSDSISVKNYLASGGVPLTNLKFLITGFNSIWDRDYGPWSVYSNTADSLKIIDWIYNRPRPLDDVIPEFFANYINVPIYQTTTPPYELVHTGGNFMNDGHGTGFSSELVLNENPGKTEAEIDTIMSKFMGIDRFIKMENLPYDGIHHIDMHMKLLNEETLLVGEYPPGVADGPQIEANLQYIQNNFLTCYGRPYRIVRIPMPPDANGDYPDQGGDYRTYTNSIIINKTVIIPTYEYQYDTTAFRIYREAMPGYNIVGINSNSIVPLLGTIHCITKEVGVKDPIFISHPPYYDVVNSFGSFNVKAFVKSGRGISQANLFWTTDTTAGYQSIPMNEISADTFFAEIPQQLQGTEIFYYISATDGNGKTITKPLTAPDGYYHFEAGETIPVELISFTGNMNGNDVKLNWSTTSEINNKGFTVERFAESLNNRWHEIGFIEGYGTTTKPQTYSFIDDDLSVGKYQYRLKQIDYDGTFEYSNIVYVTVDQPIVFTLEQNYPNPFNPVTTIKYSLNKLQQTKLKVYDVLGKEVAVLINEVKEPGNYEVKFSGEGISSGVYFYELISGNYRSVKKMIISK